MWPATWNKMHNNHSSTTSPQSRLLIGIDVGSTTVKCVAINPDTLDIIWQDYLRHETRQAETLLSMLQDIKQTFPELENADIQAFITGSGAGPLQSPVGASFIQEVNAVTLAVEILHPDVRSVIELGGQDAKIIIFDEDPETGERQVITSMNDKCASGTGATIDKCTIKVGLTSEQLKAVQFDSESLHHVAAKCGVFAETDIVNLIKSGVPSEEVMNSLADAIAMQNLSVLTRGNTLKAKVLLLGGPNTYLPFLQDCWRLRIPQIWQERGYKPPPLPLEQLIIIPDNAQYFAAYGAVIFGIQESSKLCPYNGIEKLEQFIALGRKQQLGDSSGPALIKNPDEYSHFRATYQTRLFQAASFQTGTIINGFIGLDGGSTSSKAVLLNEHGKILKKEYQLSKGNPIQDTKDILKRINDYVEQQNCQLIIKGFGATGYAADVLEQTMDADANVVETIAHMISAKEYCGDDIDVICDVGGQDIKVLFMENGNVKNFRLSNQCSAGNGMLLQAMADQFGVAIDDYAKTAFSAELSPEFSYGCAVFLDTDRVNFQKEGYSKEELFAGLCRVLPKNIWQYVVQIPRMAELGKKFVLQGGTQYNLAALKTQVDYIKQRVPEAQVLLHPHSGEAGAIGAALEALRLVKRNGKSTFIGLDAAINIKYTSQTNESTRCYFCENHCSRTFIDTVTPNGNSTRYITGFSCEKGTVESKDAVIQLNKHRRSLKKQYPNMVDYEANKAFQHRYKPVPLPQAGSIITDSYFKRSLLGLGKIKPYNRQRPFISCTDNTHNYRQTVRVGIPRILNVYTVAPFLRSYLEALGIDKRNIVFSDHTSEELWREGGQYGSIDPCYPSKVAQAHIHNLLHHKTRKKPLHTIWFPSITHMDNFISHSMGNTTCPIVAGTPNVVKAAFTKENNFFGDTQYFDAALDFSNKDLLKLQIYQQWKDFLQVTNDEHSHAFAQAMLSMSDYEQELMQLGQNILGEVENNNSIALLLLGRPYHNDPGLNHDILEEFQALGYPVLSIHSIPRQPAYLQRFFEHDLKNKLIEDVFDIRDVWPENYSANSAQKVWAAKFAARHPNIAVLDLSSFKCGHDAPTYGIIDKIMSYSNTPYMAMHDIDANKPSGSIKIRTKTFAYTLQLYQERLNNSSYENTGDFNNLNVGYIDFHSNPNDSSESTESVINFYPNQATIKRRAQV